MVLSQLAKHSYHYIQNNQVKSKIFWIPMGKWVIIDGNIKLGMVKYETCISQTR